LTKEIEGLRVEERQISNKIKTAENYLVESQEKAKQIEEEAMKKATRIEDEAKKRADKLSKDAVDQANSLEVGIKAKIIELSNLTEETKKVKANLETLNQEFNAAKERLQKAFA
jgi:cell division septum initiation protein DivIVA